MAGSHRLESARARRLLSPRGAARAARRARRTIDEYGIPRQPSPRTALPRKTRRFSIGTALFDERCRELDCISSDELARLRAAADRTARLGRESGLAPDGAPMAAAPRPHAGAGQR